MPKTPYLNDIVVAEALRGSTFTPPTLVYMGLFNGFLFVDHTMSGDFMAGGSEIVGMGYARQLATFATPASGGAITNTADLFFGFATSSWGVLQSFALFDALTGGNMLYFGTFVDSTRLISTNDAVRIKAGHCIITEA